MAVVAVTSGVQVVFVVVVVVVVVVVSAVCNIVSDVNGGCMLVMLM